MDRIEQRLYEIAAEHDREIERQRRQFLLHLWILEGLGLPDLDTSSQRQFLDRTHSELATAPGGTIRLGVYRRDAVAGVEQRAQMGRGKLRSAGEAEAQRRCRGGQRTVRR